MAYYLVKVSPEADAYLYLSTISDEILAWGTAEEMVEPIYEIDDRKRDRIQEFDHSHPLKRIERAERLGSDSMIGRGNWDSESVAVEGVDRVARKDLPEVYARLEKAHAEWDGQGEMSMPDLSDLYLPRWWEEDD